MADEIVEKVSNESTETEEPKAEAMHMTVDQMVHDLRYAQGMLNAAVEELKSLHGVIFTYVEKTHTEEYLDAIQNMTDEEIKEVTRESLREKFPKHNLMPFDAPEIKEIEGFYEYEDEEYRQYLKDLRDRLVQYETMMKEIETSRGYVQKMGDLIRDTRINQAKQVAQTDAPNSESARKFLADLEDVRECKTFFSYVTKNVPLIYNSDLRYVHDRYQKWVAKHPQYSGLKDDVLDFVGRIHGTPNEAMFVAQAVKLFIRFGTDGSKHGDAMMHQNLARLAIFFHQTEENNPIPDDEYEIILEGMNAIIHQYNLFNMKHNTGLV